MRLIGNVTNTYLVFKKIKDEFNYLFDFNNDITLNKVLIDELRSICQDNIRNNPENITILKKYKEFNVCKEHYYSDILEKGFNLLLIEYKHDPLHDRILLNYIEDDMEFENLESFYIPEIYDLDDFVGEVDFNGKDYNILNTFNSFISYSEINELSLHRDNNLVFFRRLVMAIKNLNVPIVDGTINIVKYQNNVYKYMVLDNIILITEYEQEIDEDDLPF